jgi:hypothetical protein
LGFPKKPTPSPYAGLLPLYILNPNNCATPSAAEANPLISIALSAVSINFSEELNILKAKNMMKHK